MIYIINTILIIIFIIGAIIPLIYCIQFLIDLALKKKNIENQEIIIFGFGFMYFFACLFVVFRLAGFG